MRGKTTFHIRWKLFFYDVIVFAVTSVFLLVLYEGPVKLTQRGREGNCSRCFLHLYAYLPAGWSERYMGRYGDTGEFNATCV